MKRKLTWILSVLMIAALCLALGACGGETPVTYTVTFTGENVSVPVQTIREGGLAVEPKDPSREDYDFTGWFKEGEDQPFNFSTPITQNITLVAGWKAKEPEVTVTEVPDGSGTASDPFVLIHPIQLVYFSEQINSGNQSYLKAYVELGADLDMTGIIYDPAGTTEETAFQGVFDGKNHRITGLKIQTVSITGTSYVGLFGQTSMAVIKNLNLENIDYQVTSYSSDSTVGTEVGGVVGHADLTNFRNVTVTGSIVANCPAGNTLTMGGLAGTLQTSEAYIVYTENCLTDLTLGGGIGSYDEDTLGGLYGEIYNLYGTTALINCKTAGSITGGRYAGGLVGYLNDMGSLINCASTARVEATDAGVTYAGGLVGMSSGDSIILDCFTTGRVVARPSTENAYKSYAGYLVGYQAEDDYYLYFTPGTAVINSYYNGSLSGGDNRNTLGIQHSGDFSKDFILSTLKWSEQSWSFGNTANFDDSCRPTEVTAAETANSFELKLVNGTETETRTKPVENDGYTLLGEIEPLTNQNGKVFWNWEYAEGAIQRYYMPMVKDVTLTARYYDVKGISTTYKGTATHGSSVLDSGIIRLMEDGTMQWINDTTMSGSYRYDGEHIIMTVQNAGIGTFSGTLTVAEGLKFELDAGMSGTVAYVLQPFQMTVVGEYVSQNGWILTFNGEDSLTFHDAALDSGAVVDGSVEKTSEDVLTVQGGNLLKYFDSFVITLLDDGSLSVDAQPVSGVSITMDGEIFRQYMTVSYEGEAFVGSYHLATISLGYSDDPSMSRYTAEFLANGGFLYTSEYSTTEGRYYYFDQIGQVKVILDGYISTLTYDAGLKIFYGPLFRGGSYPYSVVMTPVSEGEITGFIAEDSSFNIYTAGGKAYYISDGVFNPDAQISGDFTDGGRVTVEGKDYRVVSYTYGDKVSYKLSPIGSEEGTYTYQGASIVFDGLGGVSGDRTGRYWLYDDLVFILFDNNQMLRFSLSAATGAGNNITALPGDGWEGIWYASGRSETADGTRYENPKHYKLVVDGIGHVTLYYYHADGTYHFNWSNTWGTYTETATGLFFKLNEIQEADVQFYYENQVVYSKSFGYLAEISFVAEGYTGPTTPPALPVSWVGSYTGTTAEGSVILNLRGDLTGSFKGLPFVGLFDGDKTISFEVEGKRCKLVFDTVITLTYGEEVLTLTRQGEITEVIPGALTGTWTGTAYRGSTVVGTVTVVIESDGKITYNGTVLANVTFQAEQLVITAVSGENTYTFTWDEEEGTFVSLLRDAENSETQATLTRVD